MARFVVGGRQLDLTADEVVRDMRNVAPEAVREHLVEIASTIFPPKQVFAQVTGWDRQSFTTMEAVRVLTRLGFVCRRGSSRSGGRSGGLTSVWLLESPQEQEPASVEHRLLAIESALAVAQEAIAGIRSRVAGLEARS